MLSRGKTFGGVQSDKIPEVFGGIVSGTCQGPGLGLGFGVFLFHSYCFLNMSDTSLDWAVISQSQGQHPRST